jgi:hypothetical protein
MHIIGTKIRIHRQGSKTKIPHGDGGISLTLKTTNMKNKHVMLMYVTLLGIERLIYFLKIIIPVSYTSASSNTWFMVFT